MSTAFPEKITWNGPIGIYRTPLLEDAQAIRSIVSDIETMKYMRFSAKEPNGWTIQQVEEKLNDQLQGQKESRKLVVNIIYEGKVVGQNGFTVIDTVNRNGEVGIVLDKKCWGKNLATESFYFLFKWAFDELGLHRVYWRTTENNDGMRGWTEKVCELNIEAINYEFFNIDGKWLNSYTYALFEDDWRSRLKAILEARVYRK